MQLPNKFAGSERCTGYRIMWANDRYDAETKHYDYHHIHFDVFAALQICVSRKL